MSIANEHPAPGLIVHSDQSLQYCSHVFQKFLLRQGISGSMSERGQCWDNAPAESFWATLKRETLPLSGCFSSRKEAQDTVTRWISYYNGTRPHSQLGMRSPYQFRLRAQAFLFGLFYRDSKFRATSQFLSSNRGSPETLSSSPHRNYGYWKSSWERNLLQLLKVLVLFKGVIS